MTTSAATDADNGLDGTIEYSFQTASTEFDVNPLTGEITVASVVLDFETVPSYTLVVLGIDQSTGTKKTGSVTITVNVQDVNDNAPLCTPVSYVSLSPGIAVNDVIHNIICTDADTGTNGNMLFTITAGNTNTDFQVNNAGDLLIRNLPSQIKYVVDVTASDQGTPVLSGVEQVTVEVFGVPVITTTPMTGNIQEFPGSFVTDIAFTLAAVTTSGDTQYSIISGDGGKFKINSVSGIIYVSDNIDRETVDTYTLNVRVTDGLSFEFVDTTIVLTVDDENDNFPLLPGSYFHRPVAENIAVGIQIQDFASTDADINVNAVLFYDIDSGNADGKFAIDATGKLTLAATLDIEATSSYTLNVVVRDNGFPSLSSTAIIFIEVQDVDEFTPVFLTTGNTYNHAISEDTALGALIFTVTADDADIDNIITYSITGGNDGTFIIGSTTGQINIVQFFDRETTPSYTLTITALNGAGVTVDATLNLDINDVNDNDPVFSSDPYSFNVDEDASAGVTIGQVTVSDADALLNGDVILSVTGGNILGHFSLDVDKIVVAGNLDFEINPSYTILIEARDQGTPAARTSTGTVNIVVNAIYTQPRYAANTDTITILESTPLGTVVFDADATFAGALELIDILYVIESNTGGGKFSVDVGTGTLKVTETLDRETTDTYIIVIRAENINSAVLRDKLTLTVTLTDVNDNTPVFTPASYLFTPNEGDIIGTAMGTVIASDADLGTNSVISYSIIAGIGMTDFSINTLTGVLTNAVVLDAGVTSSYLITVQSQDGAAVPLTNAVDVVINVNDINDKIPTFTPTIVTVSVSEVANIGDIVATISASDGDTGVNGVILYSITSGNGLSHFDLKTLTGNLEIQNILDRETLPNYVLIIEAVDSGVPPNTGTCTYSIAVVDDNDNSPTFTGAPYTATIPRTSVAPHVVVTIAASDPDAGNNAVVNYFIDSGNTDDIFFIAFDTGIISTLTTLTSAADSYSLVVHAIDLGFPRRTSTTTVIITIDPPLTPVTADYSYTIAEDMAVGTALGTIGTDPVHTSGATVHGTIISGDTNGDFNMVLATRLIETNVLLDYETKSTYYLTVNLQEVGNPAITYNKAVQITVTDVNDNDPTFVASTYTIDIVENTPVNYIFKTLTASDIDSGLNGQVTYSISTVNPSANTYFNIDPVGQLSVKQSPDFESTTSITFQVLAVDGGTPSARTGATTITANIIDVLDSTSSASSAFFSFEMPTTAVNGDTFTSTFTALQFGISAGAGDTVTFSTMETSGIFGVDSSGQLSLSDQTFVYEDTKYVLTVFCDVKDVNNNVTSASGLIRVDSFKPDTEMITIRHSVTKDVIDPQM